VSFPVLVLQLAASDPPGRLGQWLVDAGLDVEVRDVGAGQPVPDQLSEWAGLVVLGGPMGAGEDAQAPFLPAVRALLRTAVDDAVPTLGICLGAQLMAMAHGGVVRPSPTGPQLGPQLMAKRQAAFSDPLFGPLPITPDVISWHHDAVTTLPPGAVHVVASVGCEYEAFRLGRLAWGLQFHIETTPETVHDWAQHDAAALAGRDLDELFAAVTEAHEYMAEVWPQFVAAFAEVVRDPASVPEPPSVRTATGRPVTDAAGIRAALAAEANAARGISPLPSPGARPGLRPPSDR
jgi:GMP synthase-like glutamine amidotransferase